MEIVNTIHMHGARLDQLEHVFMLLNQAFDVMGKGNDFLAAQVKEQQKRIDELENKLIELWGWKSPETVPTKIVKGTKENASKMPVV